jgi:hypothetical protein
MKKQTKLIQKTDLATPRKTSLTDHEQEIVATSKKLIRNHGPMLFFKNGKPTKQGGENENLSYDILLSVCKIGHPNAALQTVASAAAARYSDDNDSSFGTAVSQIAAFEPSNYLEATLAAEMIAVNAGITKLMRLALLDEQTPEGRQLYLNLATKLQRTYLTQIEMYQKMQGKAGQKVTVERVTINAGGQAVVGTVEHHQEGGVRNEKEE